MRVGVSPVFPASLSFGGIASALRGGALSLLFALSACNPPDVDTPRHVWQTPLGGSGTGAVPTAGTGAGTGTAGVGGGLPPAGGGGFGGVAGMLVAGTGVPPTAGVGSSGGSGGTTPSRMFNAGTDPNRNAVVPGTVCDRLSAIQCAGEEFCCQNPGRDVTACKTAVQRSCEMSPSFEDVAGDDAAGFDAAQALIVFTELERLASQCDPTIAMFGESYDGLRSIFAGTVGAGGNCRPSNPLNMTMQAGALASCSDYAQQACMPSLSAWTCTPHASAGGHCFSDINCQIGLWCDNPNFSLSGADCQQRKGVGMSCELDNECQSLFCRGSACVNADAQAAYCLAAAPSP